VCEALQGVVRDPPAPLDRAVTNRETTQGGPQDIGKEMSITTDRLFKVKPGESIVFYRGRIEEDLERCKPRENEKMFFIHGRRFGPGAPKYERLLREIWTAVKFLEATEQIVVSEKVVELPAYVFGPNDRKWKRQSWFIEYTATGVENIERTMEIAQQDDRVSQRNDKAERSSN